MVAIKRAFTAGPVRLDGQYVTNSAGATIADCGKSSLIYTAEKVANANLIAESFTVAHETGLTPRQLADDLRATKGVLAATRERVCRLEVERDELRKLAERCKELETAITRIADHAANSTRNGDAAMSSTLDDVASFARAAIAKSGGAA